MSAIEQLDPSWQRVLAPQLAQPYMQSLREFLSSEKKAGKVIYPPSAEVFAAFQATSFDRVKVVILGQDPYHGPGQAHGLCFSVRGGTQPPPSLVNIFKEIEQDLGIAPSGNGDLSYWARQGVLLLNAVLTVQQGNAGSHQGKGWETLTDAIIDHLNQQRHGLVFLLWGSHAQKKGARIDRQRHQVLQAPHPSPLSAHRGFFGCRHFSQVNDYLASRQQLPIDWSVPNPAP